MSEDNINENRLRLSVGDRASSLACLPVTTPVIPHEWEHVRWRIARMFNKPAILAGGSVRDHLLGIPINDLDVFILDTPFMWRLEAAKTLQRSGIEAK